MNEEEQNDLKSSVRKMEEKTGALKCTAEEYKRTMKLRNFA